MARGKTKQAEPKGKKLTMEDRWAQVILTPEQLEEDAALPCWPTGSPRADRLLNGGLPMSSISIFYGPPQSGKSALALSTAGRVNRAGGTALYIDLERGLDLRHPGTVKWLRALGIDPFNTKQFKVARGFASGEEMWSMVIYAMKKKMFDYVVIDSMDVVASRSELEGEIGESNFGATARLNSQALRVLFNHFESNPDIHITIIAQARANIGGYVPFIHSGGKALDHYSAMVLQFRKIGRTINNDGSVSTKIDLRIDKTRFGAASSVELMLHSERGIDVAQEVYEYALGMGYIHKTGGGYYWFYDRPRLDFEELSEEERQDPKKGFVDRIRSEEAMKAYLQEEGWVERLYGGALDSVTVEMLDDKNESID